MDWDELEEEARIGGCGFIYPICCVLFGLCSFIADKEKDRVGYVEDVEQKDSHRTRKSEEDLCVCVCILVVVLGMGYGESRKCRGEKHFPCMYNLYAVV